MSTQTSLARRSDPVIQFSVFTPNRLGRLHDLMSLLGSHDVHVVALAVLDTTDSAIIRIVVSDPDRARSLLNEHQFPFTESHLVAVEIGAVTDMGQLMDALLAAELNIYYLYAFLNQPNGCTVLGLSMEDNEMADQVLRRHQFKVLKQGDISR